MLTQANVAELIRSKFKVFGENFSASEGGATNVWWQNGGDKLEVLKGSEATNVTEDTRCLTGNKVRNIQYEKSFLYVLEIILVFWINVMENVYVQRN